MKNTFACTKWHAGLVRNIGIGVGMALVLALQACAPLNTSPTASGEAAHQDILGKLLTNCPLQVQAPSPYWGDLPNAKVVSGSVTAIFTPSNRTYLAVIKQSTGVSRLDIAMVEAVRQWACDKPPQVDRSVNLEVPFHFSLDGSPLPLPTFRATFAGTHAVESSIRIPDPNALTGRRKISKGVRPLERTNTIPGTLGTRMGLIFTMDSAYATPSYPYRNVLKFPPPGLTHPVTGKHAKSYERISDCKPGQECWTGFSFDEPWEIVPGDWVFEIWMGHTLLHRETFTVVLP